MFWMWVFNAVLIFSNEEQWMTECFFFFGCFGQFNTYNRNLCQVFGFFISAYFCIPNHSQWLWYDSSVWAVGFVGPAWSDFVSLFSRNKFYFYRMQNFDYRFLNGSPTDFWYDAVAFNHVWPHWLSYIDCSINFANSDSWLGVVIKNVNTISPIIAMRNFEVSTCYLSLESTCYSLTILSLVTQYVYNIFFIALTYSFVIAFIFMGRFVFFLLSPGDWRF